MVQDAARRVAEYAKDRCGRGLRTVAYLAEDEWTCVYLRDDLQEEYTEGTYAEAAAQFQTETDPPAEPGSLPLGQRHGVIYHHDNAFVIQLTVSPSESVVVSVDTSTGRNLLTFIDECRKLAVGEA